MDVILDTCALLSLIGLTDRRLSGETLSRIRTATNVYVSSCSMFEIAIKHKRQGLSLGMFANAEQLWTAALSEYLLTELPVSHDVFYQSVRLPDHHADPFDRIIIAHARKEKVAVVTFDETFRVYDVAVIS
jgi:PIN domain nuclease of toxin-antitoxin system